MFAKFTYTRLATNSPRCRRCSNDGIPCIALRKICGKRDTDFCLACTALKVRSCQIPEVIDLLSGTPLDFTPFCSPNLRLPSLDNDTQPSQSSNGPSIYPIKCEPVDPSLADARPVVNATPATQQPHGAETPFKYRQSLPLSSPHISSDLPHRSTVVPASPLLPSVSPSVGHTLPTRLVPPQANPHNTPKSPLLGPMPASVAPNGTPAAKRVAQISQTASDASMQKSPQAVEATPRTPLIPQTPSQPRTPRVRKPTDTNATPGPSRVKKEGEKKGKVAPASKKRELDIPTTLLPVFDDDEPAIIPIMSRRRTSTGGKRFGEVKEEAPVAKKKKRKLCLFTSAERVGLPPLVIPDRPVPSPVAQAPMTPRATPGPSSAIDVPTSVSEDLMDVDPPHTVAESESLSAPAVLQRSSIAAAPPTLQQPSLLPTPPLTNYIPALYELPDWIVSHVRTKAYEIITHVDKFGCESPAIAFPISDMRHRLARINQQESTGTEDNLLVFKQMLLRSGKDVVAAFVKEGTQDVVLECLIAELGERLAKMESSSMH